MQRRVDGQLSPYTPKEGNAAAAVNVHVDAAPAGLCDVTTPPLLSLATHSNVDGQDALSSGACQVSPLIGGLNVLRSTYVTFHALLPRVGSFDVTTSPSASVATQSDNAAHEIALSWRPSGLTLPPQWVAGHGPESTIAVCQAAAPPVGLVEVIISPARSTTTHKDSDGQDTASNAPAAASFALCQPLAAAGLVIQKTYPAVSTATHNDDETQETPDNDAAHMLSPQLCMLLST
jgi:hypothetical protein